MHIRRLIPAPIRAALRPLRRVFVPDAQAFLGHLRSRGPDGLAGWIHDPDNAARRLAFEVLVRRNGRWHVLDEGVADRYDAELAVLGIGDARYGFCIPLPAGISPDQADDVQIRPKGARRLLDLPPSVSVGYLHTRTAWAVAGWAFNRAKPSLRLSVEAGIERSGAWQVLATGIAGDMDPALVGAGLGDGRHGFRITLPPGLAPQDLRRVEVRVAGCAAALPYHPAIAGFVRSRSTTHIQGWAHQPGVLGRDLELVVSCITSGSVRVLGQVRADRPDPVMQTVRGDPNCGFRLDFHPPLTPEERDSLRVGGTLTDCALPFAPPAAPGFVRAVSARRVGGWLRDPQEPSRRLTYEVVCSGTRGTRIVAIGVANMRDPGLAAVGSPDPDCGFEVAFDPPLTEAERKSVQVRWADTGGALPHARAELLGYVRSRSTTHVDGWMRHAGQPSHRLAFAVRCTLPGAERIVATGIADRHDPVLAAAGVGDAGCGFRAEFDPPLEEAESAALEVCWTQTGDVVPDAAPALLGYVRSRSIAHVEGWMQRAGYPSHRLAYTVRCTLPGAERVLATGTADRRDPALAEAGVAQPACGFHVVFDPPLTAAERDCMVVECTDTGDALPLAEGAVIGYVRECTAQHVAGWMRREDAPDRRLAYEVRCTLPGVERVIARGVADQDDPALAMAGLADAGCGFHASFAALSDLERDHIEVWPEGAAEALPRARSMIVGYVRERSTRHVSGWIQNTANPAERIVYDVVVAGEERVIASGVAEQWDRVLFALGMEDAVHGFRLLYDAPITEAEAERVEVRPRSTGRALPPAPDMLTEWKPIRYIAMDIVDNCNLRCPFCLFDHAPVHKTTVMDDDTFARALRFLPYVGPEGLWMSCLHEPTMHPKLPDLIERIPREHRHRMHYTTNLTRRMPDRYWEVLANSGLANLNVSIESRDPAIYERMRKGARHKIFLENWEKLLEAFSRGSAPPPLRYISMAYKSNYRELPELIAWLRAEKRAWKVEIRDTYVADWIPMEFREAEFLERHEWEWLRDQLAHYDPTEVTLCLPPEFDNQSRPEPVTLSASDASLEMPAAPNAEAPVADEPVEDAPVLEAPVLAAPVVEVPAAPAPAPRREVLLAKKKTRVPGLLEGRILHDGTMIVIDSLAGNYPHHGEEVARVNIRDIEDVEEFIMSLVDRGD